MYYVYCRYVKTGREDYINCYDTESDAAHKIAACIKIDWSLGQQGEYYYFIKKH